MPTTWDPNAPQQAPQGDRLVNPLNATWTCTKCNQPVAGPYAKCENCGWYPSRKSEPLLSPATCWCRKCISWVAPLDGKCPKCHNSDTLEPKNPQTPTNRSNDPINPNHYKSHPSNVECITIIEHTNFNLGNAIKYIWRFSFGGTQNLDDLRKAKWYLEREIAKYK